MRSYTKKAVSDAFDGCFSRSWKMPFYRPEVETALCSQLPE